MKRLWVVAVLATLCNCASSGQSSSGPLDLDTAIQQAAKEINNALPAASKVALLNFSSESDVFSEYVLEEMSIELVKTRKLVVVDRKDLDLIRSEMNFQWSGEVSDESAQEIGKLLGAQTIVSGSLVNMGKSYRFRTKAINVISAKIETSSSLNVKSDEQIQYLLSQGRKTSTPQGGVAQGSVQGGTPTTPAQAQPAAPTQPAAPEVPSTPRSYKIGDIGPAGGLIFYDKGNNSGGWRYLEAAPSDLPRKLPWASELIPHNYTERAVGRGKQNTQGIMQEASKKGGGFGWAAQACVTLTLGGFNDWFLPSQDEMHYMYGHLHMQGLGNFRNEWYWTSTANGENYYIEDFSNGKQGWTYYYRTEYYVRPIRQVPGPSGNARSSVDGGAVGGIGDSGNGGTAAVSKSRIGFSDVLIFVGGLGILGLIGWGIYKAATNPDEEASARAAMGWR
jgi:TolB-like protein